MQCQHKYLTINLSLYKKVVLLFAVFCLAIQASANNDWRKLKVNFYGHELRFSISPDFLQNVNSNLNSTEQQVQWFVQQHDISTFTNEVTEFANQLKLDDVGFVLLVKKAAEKLKTKSQNGSTEVFCYAVFALKGYDVLLGEGKDGLTVYGNTNVNIKNCLYVVKHNKTYYDLSFKRNKQPTTEHQVNLPEITTHRIIFLNKHLPPQLNNYQQKKVWPFEFDGNLYFFNSVINMSLVSYYNDLPDIELSQVYLNYGISERYGHTLIKQLSDATAYMNKEKAVNFILAFIQNFSYAKDIEVLGNEKFAFPEESLAANYTDCEDRSMLFAYLVREVLHLQSIGLLYESASHMNVAIESWRNNTKNGIEVFDMQFVVCEPSGAGFVAGQQSVDVSLAKIIKW